MDYNPVKDVAYPRTRPNYITVLDRLLGSIRLRKGIRIIPNLVYLSLIWMGTGWQATLI